MTEENQERIVVERRWNAGIAFLLSLFFPGVGQMYKGQVGPGLGWIVLVGAAHGLTGLLFFGAIVAGLGLISFVALGTGVMLHIICILDAAIGDPQKRSWLWIVFAITSLLSIVVGVSIPRIAKETTILGSPDPGTSDHHAPHSSSIRAPYYPNHCGCPDYKPSFISTAETWKRYKCLSRLAAGNRWGSCLRRHEYTSSVGNGCPYNERCCPPGE